MADRFCYYAPNNKKKMKLTSWNCKMAYKKKAKMISEYHPDLVIIPECEYLGEGTSKNLWFGNNLKKGIGIFSYSDWNRERRRVL
jgi:exodeoxyribonuclease-3